MNDEMRDMARKVATVLPEWPPGVWVWFTHEDGKRWGRRLDGGDELRKESHRFIYDREIDGEPVTAVWPDLLDGATRGALLDLLPGPTDVVFVSGTAWADKPRRRWNCCVGHTASEEHDDWKTACGLAVGAALLAHFGGAE